MATNNFGSVYVLSWFGDGAKNNSIGWGSIYPISTVSKYVNRVLADGGVIEAQNCINN